MGDLPAGAAWLHYDGRKLSTVASGPGRRLIVDARCVEGVAVRGAYAHVCALPDEDAVLRFDQPEVQQVRRDALAWWTTLLGVHSSASRRWRWMRRATRVRSP